MLCQLLPLVPTQETHLGTGNDIRNGRMRVTRPGGYSIITQGSPGLTPGLLEDLETGSSKLHLLSCPTFKAVLDCSF